VTLPIRRTFRGEQDQVASARDFVRRVVGRCPLLDEAVLLTSELCTNTLQHTASGQGGSFEVTVHCAHDSLRVEVRDDGSTTVPAVGGLDELSGDGRGLTLVDLIATRWGQSGDEFGRSVFFELCWSYPQTTTSHTNAPTVSPPAEAGETSMATVSADVCEDPIPVALALADRKRPLTAVFGERSLRDLSLPAASLPGQERP
jgi:anti-sigma regulatory factor (Ser/Thr protein kinase)